MGAKLITAEIAGYTHDTENKCPDCVRDWVEAQLRREGHGRFGFDGSTTEDLLNSLAGLWDIDRDYVDSNDFPVPFSGQQACTDASWAAFEGQDNPTCTCGNDFLGEF